MKDISPNISVGIMSRKQLKINFSGEFNVGGRRIDPNCEYSIAIKDRSLFIKSSNDKMLSEQTVTFTPANIATDYFEIQNVLIGVDFHWQQEENQRFQGALQLLIKDKEVLAINIVPIENYLHSVISSEMNPNASLNLLKAHAII